MLDLKITIGSTRPGRAAERVIPWITSASREHGGFNDPAWWARPGNRCGHGEHCPPAIVRPMAGREGAGK